jgi:ubiquitin-protein ligase
MTIRDDRLAFELTEMERLKMESSLIDFQPNDEILPDQYMVQYRCKGLFKKNVPGYEHVVHIYLPANYPAEPPVIRFKTPIFHPNIRAMIDSDEQVERLARTVGGIENLEQLFNKDPTVRSWFEAHICLDVLDKNWTPEFSLYDLCLELGGMIQYQRYNVDDPMNHDAADWTREALQKPGVLPIDNRDLRDLLKVKTVTVPGKNEIKIITVEKVNK